MGIYYDDNRKVFHLQSEKSSYIIEMIKGVIPAHVYWGPKLAGREFQHPLNLVERCSFSPTYLQEDKNISLDTLPSEFPSYGNGDFREPALEVHLVDGTTVTDFRYKSHTINKGKPALKGLPATYVESEEEAETLEIILQDDKTGLIAALSYTVFNNQDVITRSVRIENLGKDNLVLKRVLSANVDFHDSDYDMLQLSGTWTRERHIHKRPLVPGIQRIDSKRGSSSHQQNPFMALLAKDATEDHGEVYGFSLVYSGSFLAQAEVDQYGISRVGIGIQPFNFQWLLEPGESFQAPEAVLVRSSEGLGGLSRTYHRLYRTRLCRGEFRDSKRPILINNWEATYFNFNADKIKEIAKAGKELGLELFVLDDGWFGKRDNDDSSLGDWVEDRRKLPEGLGKLGEDITAMGMEFGLWFEPEMVSPESDLYREHPDWCLHVPGHKSSLARQQLVLDLSRKDVCDYIVESVSSVLSSAPITYVKWDMNRNMTEIGSALLPAERQRETAHRYILGLYDVLERIVSRFPHILFESCSGGGGRFDPGMLYYMPQTWTSDDTDAVERLKIQYGTSMVYPASSMGAHVSAVPNHQVHRITPLETRGHVAMSGNFGYELDLTKLTEAEREDIRKQVSEYKELRMLIQYGDFYRLLSPFEGNETAWMFVSADKKEAFATYFQVLAGPNPPLRRLRLKGLDPAKSYKLELNGGVYRGDELMHFGLTIPQLEGDFRSLLFVLREV
ncbi:alpha-galactosidase [Paenibacillus odorifer]|uniref:Alpha-galactosidase n=1 Tax=Paenibacillus odorifer TaxID=189426 RepID=A0A1R0WV51_9BACL|nr:MULTISPECIES: alpha-galactosidase [Paenibacillus]ETT57670.1 Alpha-galactosidase [Paenibacillus sp. FSL H8-237]OMD21843.1 alpha-galactosidase [Paenibacillus odorifer]OME45574.1 alpha-galactosidase [Paenibacillus odorifer]OME46301.1 alpha-galactosidase [Paenibacillus odorifer]OZQ64633.1 alpha-galactosidase [Paenibacillus odorifer]